MQCNEMARLLGIDEKELSGIVARNDDASLKKIFRLNMKKAHPDNGPTGDTERFMKLQGLYNTICNSGLLNVIEFGESDAIVFDIDETRGKYNIITDITGVEHDRKTALSRENCKIRLRMTVTVDGVDYPVEWKTLYRLDNKYIVEVRPFVDKAAFFSRKSHSMKVVVNNTFEELSSEMSWNGPCKEIGVKVMGDRLIVMLRASLNFESPDVDE